MPQTKNRAALPGRTPLYTGQMEIFETPLPIAGRGKGRSTKPTDRAEKPNATTRKAMADARAGRGVVRCEDMNDMFKKLGM